MSPYKSLCGPMACNGSLWVLIGPYSSLWILMGPYRSLCVYRVLMGPYRSFVSLLVPIGSYAFPSSPTGS